MTVPAWPERGDRDYVEKMADVIAGIQTGDLPIALAGIEGALGAWEPTEGPVGNMRVEVANALDYPDTGIQGAINSGAPIVEIPAHPSEDWWSISEPLVPKTNQIIRAKCGFQTLHYVSGSVKKVRIRANFDGPAFLGNNVHGVTLDGLTITGSSNPAHTNNVGLYLDTASRWDVRDCMLSEFAGPAILWLSGGAMRISRCLTTDCVLNRAGHTDYIGVLDLGGTDAWVSQNEINASANAIGTGFIAALVVRNGFGCYSDNVFEQSELGVVCTNQAAFSNRFVNNRADINYGHGFVVNHDSNIFIGNHAFRNSLATHNTYDGFRVTGLKNIFIGNYVSSLSSDSVLQRYGFNDSASAFDNTANIYIGNTHSFTGTGLYNISDVDNIKLDLRTRTANADTSGATLEQLEAEVNEIKALLRTQGLLKP